MAQLTERGRNAARRTSMATSTPVVYRRQVVSADPASAQLGILSASVSSCATASDATTSCTAGPSISIVGTTSSSSADSARLPSRDGSTSTSASPSASTSDSSRSTSGASSSSSRGAGAAAGALAAGAVASKARLPKLKKLDSRLTQRAQASARTVEAMRGRERGRASMRRQSQGHGAREARSQFATPLGKLSQFGVFLDQPLGEGAQSNIFEGVNFSTGERVVVKVLKKLPSGARARTDEARIMAKLPPCRHVVRLLGSTRVHGEQVLVIESIGAPHEVERVLVGHSDAKLRYYLCRLLLGLRHCHAHHVIHGDVKAGNFVLHRASGEFRLIDFGHAQRYRKRKRFRRWMGTPTFKAPEMLLHYPYYNYAADMWSFGVVAARTLVSSSLLAPISRAGTVDRSVEANIDAIVRMFGTDAYAAFLAKLGLGSTAAKRGASVSAMTQRGCPAGPTELRELCSRGVLAPAAEDLLRQLLVLDPKRRLTAQQALDHPYFDPVRDELAAKDAQWEARQSRLARSSTSTSSGDD